MKLDRRTVYVSGGSSGIGLACARFAIERGARVVIFARDEARLTHAANELRNVAALGGEIIALSVDVCDPALCAAALTDACLAHGAPDVLINSAGLGGAGYFESESFETFEQRVKVNLFGVRNAISAVLPMMKLRGGRIVNISSMAGLLGVFGFTGYGASKSAVIGFSAALRTELVFHDIIVQVFCPPDVDTPMLAAARESKPLETKALSQSGGLMSPGTAATELYRGLGSQRFLVIPGWKNRAIHRLARLAPSLVEALMHRKITRARRSASRE